MSLKYRSRRWALGAEVQAVGVVAAAAVSRFVLVLRLPVPNLEAAWGVVFPEGKRIPEKRTPE